MVNMLQKIKSKIIDKTADAISYPARRQARNSIKQSDYDLKTLKADPEGPVSGPLDESNPNFRKRVQANQVRFSRGAKGRSY